MPRLEQLIARCEDSEIFTQRLDENTTKMEVKGKNAEITFLTDPEIVLAEMKGQGKIGIVTWFPSDVFERKDK